MKNFITKHLLGFAVLTAIWTIIFRFFLSYGLEQQLLSIILLSTIVYTILMFITGRYFGRKDREYLPLFDIGFRFHLTAYIVHIGISELWFLAGFNSHYETISMVHNTAFYWGMILAIHFIIYLVVRKRTINGLDKNNLFE